MTEPTPGGDRFDVLCVGDVCADVYLTPAADQVVVVEGPGRPLLELPLGGKVPCDESATVAAGGNAANAAVACARLGLRVGLVAYVGADGPGRDAVDALHAEGIDSSLVRLDRRTPTNRNVVLRVGAERTILVHHEQHEYHWPHLRPSEVPSWLYLSSVGRDAHAYEEQIADWLEEHPDVSFAFEPGTYQIAHGAGRLARLYRRADLVVCNREEAAVITGRSPGEAAGSLLAALADLGPGRVVITDGPSGAYGADGTGRYRVPSFPDPAPPVDRTGAGDAFAATTTAVVARGGSLDAALARAAVNSMRVVQSVGSQSGLLRTAELEAALAAAPGGFAATAVGDGQ